MDELEKFVNQNRDAFDDVEPIEGHEARFLRKLEQEVENKKSAPVGFWRIAAAVILLVVLSVSLLIPRFNNPDDVQYGSMSLSDVSDDMANVEFYYRSKLAGEYEKINQLAHSDPLVTAYLGEIDKLNKEYKKLEATLYESGTHEKVVLAMIENFRLRLSLMEKLEEKKLNTSKNDSL